MTLNASFCARAPIRSVRFCKAGGSLAVQAEWKNPAPIAKSRQTGAVAVAIRLHGVFQCFRTAPSLEAALPTLSALPGPYRRVRRVGAYLRGSGNCSTMNAQPEVSLGFFSAFLIT
jgi:hypothetical protein